MKKINEDSLDKVTGGVGTDGDPGTDLNDIFPGMADPDGNGDTPLEEYTSDLRTGGFRRRYW